MKYDVSIGPDDDGTSHALVANMVGSNKRVLDIGCATGYLAEALRRRGNRVWGVEIDPEAAEKARPHLEGLLVADVEGADLAKEFGEGAFDVLVFADVLEHLRQPGDVLRRSRAVLAPGGYLVASIPNIAHGAIRLSLLQGRFDYTPLGLLDETHLRFFTRTSVHRLFSQAGFATSDLMRTTAAPLETEIPLTANDFSTDVMDQVSRDPDAYTYQFIIKAVPVDADADQLLRLSTELWDLRLQLDQVLAGLAKVDGVPVVGVFDAQSGISGRGANEELRLACVLAELRRRLLGFDVRVYRFESGFSPAGLGDEPAVPLFPWDMARLRMLRAGVAVGVLLLGDENGCDADVEKTVTEIRDSGLTVLPLRAASSESDALALASRVVGLDLLEQRHAQLRELGFLPRNGPYLVSYFEPDDAPSSVREQLEIISRLQHLTVWQAPESITPLDLMASIASADLVVTNSENVASLSTGLRRGVVGVKVLDPHVAPETTQSGPVHWVPPEEVASAASAAISTGTDVASIQSSLDIEFDNLAGELLSSFAPILLRDLPTKAEAIAQRLASLESANQALRDRLANEREALLAVIKDLRADESSPSPSNRAQEMRGHLTASDEVVNLQAEIDRIYATRTMRTAKPFRDIYRRLRSRRP